MTLEELTQQRAQILYKAKTDRKLQSALLNRCKRDIYFWIENFVWIYEPRKSPPRIPMSTEGNFKYQQDIIKKVVECIEQEKDLFIEKSRDMGLSWLTMVIFTWGWLFHGWNTLVGSRKEEEVDKMGDMGSLLPKVRFMLQNCPDWMLPANFDVGKHGNWKNILNPQNNATIAGESNNANFGTGDRRKAVLMDEFAKWEYTDRSAWTSAAQTTPCRIALSTPLFKGNKFYDLSKDPGIEKMRIHYTLNPAKNEKWAEEQRGRMSQEEFAQELDIDYSGTLQAGVYTEELQKLKARGGVAKKVKYSDKLPVYAAMDFGMGDLTAIVVFQMLHWAEEIYIIDCYQNNNKPIAHYAEWLKDPDREWNKDVRGKYIEGWADLTLIPDPNQATNREMQSGKSLQEILSDDFIVETYPIGKLEKISAVKKLFPKLWIADPEENDRMNDFLDAVEGYHYKYDEIRGEYKREPVHDKNSHMCDALGYLSAFVREDPRDYQQNEHQLIYNEDQISSAGI